MSKKTNTKIMSNSQFYALLDSIEEGLSEKYKYALICYKQKNPNGYRPLGRILSTNTTFKGIIYSSFVFKDTTQGHIYWNNIANSNK